MLPIKIHAKMMGILMGTELGENMATRQRMRLTDRGIRAKPPGLHSDGDGLMLQVTENGARTWILRTLIQGKRRDMGLGGWPTVSLKEARDKAVKYRKIAREGGDPFIDRDKSKAPIPTFQKAAEAVHGSHSGSWKNIKHRDQWINTLRDYAFPLIGSLRVDAVKSGDIMRTLGPIWISKPETARRVLQRIGMVMLWAKGKGFRTDAPSDEISAARKALPKQTDTEKHHEALPYKDLPSFLIKLRASGASDAIKLGFEFLILTATRTNEVLEAQWPEIDLDTKIWTIPASRMKAKREHQVPLSDRCVEILNSARKLNASEKGHLFPGTVSGKPLSNMVFLMALRRMELPITAHGFRSTFRVWCAEQTRFPREVAEAALAHVVRDATEAAYQRSTFFDLRRDLMSDWSRFATKRSADIVKLRPQRA